MTTLNDSPSFWALAICVVIGLPASLILGVSIGGKVIRSLRSGVAVSSSRAEYRRVETPPLFWLTLSLQAFNAAACLLVALALTALPLLAICGPIGQRSPTRSLSGTMAIEAAAESYKADNGHFPSGDSVAISKALTGTPADQKIYLEWPAKSTASNGALLDPWGTPYRFKSGESFTIQSAGPNKRFEDPHTPGSDDLATE